MRSSLVTGGAGFIGSHLVKALLEAGDRVRVLDNFSTGTRKNLADLQGPLEVLDGDLRDRAAIDRAVSGMDVIFHQAALVSVPGSMADPAGCFEINVAGTDQLLEAARQANVGKVVLASSSAVYGDCQHVPLDEFERSAPQSPYAASKLTNEVYGSLYTRALDLPVVSLRYFNVYGPRQPAGSDYAAVIPIFLNRLHRGQPAVIYGDGGQTRDFIFVADVVQANLSAAQSPEADGLALNICTGQETSILDLVQTICSLLEIPENKKHQPARPGDIYRSIGSPQRAREIMAFQPQTSLVDGLRETLTWVKQQLGAEAVV